MTTHYVQNAEELADAYKTAQGGDRIELAPGEYGGARLWGRDFGGGGLTITSADPGNRAVLTEEISLRDTAGITLTGLEFAAQRVADSMSNAWVDAQDVSRLTVTDMVFTGYVPRQGEGADPLGEDTSRTEPIVGYGYGLGLLVKRGTDITISDVEFRDLRGALKIGESSQISVSRLDIHDVREGINIFDIQETVIEDSRFYDFKPWKTDFPQDDDHPDMIQYWGLNSKIGIHDLTIRDNLFYQSVDDLGTQTIFGQMGGAAPGVTAEDFVITGNTIINGRINALAFHDVTGIEITDNLMLPNRFAPEDAADPGIAGSPRIVLRDVRDALVSGNIFLPVGEGRPISIDGDSADSGTVDVTGNTLLSRDPDDPLFWKPYAAAVTRPTTLDAASDDTPPPPPPPDPEPDDAPDDVPDPDNAPDDPPGDTTDGPTGPGGADLSGMNADDLARYDAFGAEIRIGTSGADLLRGRNGDTFLFGLGGADAFKESLGNDVMHGGGGADRFIIDLRAGGAQNRDLILDLDFGEGDTLTVISDTAGLFSDAADPDNPLSVLNNGARADFNSRADLAEAAASGAMHADWAADGAGLSLVFAAAQNRSVELAGYAPGDIGLDDTPPPPPPPDPEPDDAPDDVPDPDNAPDDPPGDTTDGPTGPGGADLSGMNADDLARYDAFGAEIRIGTSGADLLRGRNGDTFLFGLGGADAFKESLGNDVMHGGGGADRFIIDLRAGGAQNRDLILDLDFGEGDTLTVISDTAGLFSDAADPDNPLSVLNNGARADFNSRADLAEAAASGAMHADWAADGAGLSLVFAAAQNRSVELAGYAPGDIGLDDTPPPPPPPDPEPDDVPAPDNAPEDPPGDTTDGPTGPGGADLSGMNADDLARYEAFGAEIRIGTSGADLLRGRNGDTFLFGLGGADAFKESLGNDVMHGGGGADRFIIDLRAGGAQNRDLILDLDFGEGDTLTVISDTAGLFSDAADPDNPLSVLNNGARADFNSRADLAEAAASGAMHADWAADGAGLSLVFAAAQNRSVELAGYAPEDLLA